MTQKYQEQFERMKRWYELFKKIDNGVPHTLSSDHYQDVVFAFFQNCFHLKDQMKNDNSVAPGPRAKVEQFINQNYRLQLCPDICNGTKHLKLTKRPPHTGKTPKFESRKIALTVGPTKPTIQVKWSITTQTGKVDAFQLASDCIQKWKDFFVKHKL